MASFASVRDKLSLSFDCLVGVHVSENKLYCSELSLGDCRIFLFIFYAVVGYSVNTVID